MRHETDDISSNNNSHSWLGDFRDGIVCTTSLLQVRLAPIAIELSMPVSAGRMFCRYTSSPLRIVLDMGQASWMEPLKASKG